MRQFNCHYCPLSERVPADVFLRRAPSPARQRQREEEEALELERQRQLEIEDYISLDPVANHAKIIAEDGMNESMLHGASPPARTPQRLVSNSPVYRKERWQNAAAVLIQSVWRGTHFRRVNKLLFVAIKKLYEIKIINYFYF